MTVGTLDDGVGTETVDAKLCAQVRRRVATWAANGVKGAVGGLEFDLLVARACAARQCAHTNHCRISVPVTAQANRILPRARGSIGWRWIVDDVLNDISAEVDSTHSFSSVRVFHPMGIVAIDALDVLGVGESGVRRSLSRFQQDTLRETRRRRGDKNRPVAAIGGYGHFRELAKFGLDIGGDPSCRSRLMTHVAGFFDGRLSAYRRIAEETLRAGDSMRRVARETGVVPHLLRGLSFGPKESVRFMRAPQPAWFLMAGKAKIVRLAFGVLPEKFCKLNRVGIVAGRALNRIADCGVCSWVELNHVGEGRGIYQFPIGGPDGLIEHHRNRMIVQKTGADQG